MMFQANSRHGLHSTKDFDPQKWTMFDAGEEGEEKALSEYDIRHGMGYDWAGVLGFTFKGRQAKEDDGPLYCFSWCALALGAAPARWQTPERLLEHIIQREQNDR